MTDQVNIGPAAIAEASESGGPGFCLAKSEWIAIQTYVTDGLALPTDDAGFRNSLGAGAPDSLADFEQLIAAYKTLNQHCATWQNSVFPASVSLASDVYDYGANKAPVYYPPILAQAQILQDDPSNAQAAATLKAILDTLQATASGYAAKAQTVAKQIQQFADDSEADQSILVGPHGDAGLVKYYNDKYGTASAEVVEFNKEIEAQRLILDSANAEYDHDVVVASTTPTYVWVWPFGTIAAAVVAGVYGDKAVKALERARAAQEQINTLSAKIAADAALMSAIFVASNGMGKIVRELAAALPAIQKIEGVWGAMSDDLTNISKMIDTNIRDVPPIIMGLGVDVAVKAWHNVALNADAYRHNAYVKESGPPTLTMLGWKVATQFSPAPLPLPVAA